MRTSILLLLAIFLGASATAQLVDDRTITVLTGTDVINKRQAIVNYIWGTEGFPSTELPNSVVTNVPSPLAGLENLERVDLLRVNDTTAHRGRVFHYVPLRKNGQVVAVHQGHDTTFAGSDALTDSSTAGGLRRTINALLMDGYGVLAVYMPHVREALNLGGGVTEAADTSPSHDAMFDEPIATGSALKWFLEPTIVALNHVQSLYNDYHMIGLSGGGWTTTLCAAVDTRIRMSFPVAGTIPLYLRGPSSVGDKEQYISSFYSIAGYPDLYVLGAHGTNRKQVQILNRLDDCCFGQSSSHHNQGTPDGWTAAVREYERNVRIALFNLGPANMSFRVEIDDAAPSHLVSWNAVIGTVLAELNGGRRYVGASSVSNTFVRGGDTRLWHRNASGAFTQTPYNVIGVAAAVENAVTSLDVFYRDSANRLQYASLGSGGWTNQQLLLPGGAPAVAIADPAAVGSPGRFDVVAVGTNYQLYHWTSTGSGVTVQNVTGSAFVRGAPSMLARAGGLDVFYRGDARATYHARWNGSSWTTTHLGGLMQDFPSGAVTPDGTLRVFLRGMSGQLWQAFLPPGSSTWTFQSISGNIMGIPLIVGSPAALVQSDGTLKVYARNSTANLLMFTLGSSWTVTNVSGGITGSPTPTTSGPLVRGFGGGLFWYNGSGFVSMGGWFD
ncbi:MAG TPA: hypothetical protein VF883_23605 [Thermoanaerobaculia bacterium]|jgi:hypothetical protein